MSGVRLRIIGLGNPLRGDDGAGVAVVEMLGRTGLPAGVEVLDGGTGGLTLLHMLEGAERVVLVDAAEMGLAPGSRRRVDVLRATVPEGSDLSVHQAGMAEVVALGRRLGLLPPRLELRAIQPAKITYGQGLSGPVAAAVTELAAELRAEVDSLPD